MTGNQIKQSFKTEVKFYFEHRCYWSRELRLEFCFTMVAVWLECCPKRMPKLNCNCSGTGSGGGNWKRWLHFEGSCPLIDWGQYFRDALVIARVVCKEPTWASWLALLAPFSHTLPQCHTLCCCPTANRALIRHVDDWHCINCFSHCHDEYMTKDNSRKKVFILAQGWQFRLWLWSHRSRNVRQVVASCLEPGSREK